MTIDLTKLEKIDEGFRLKTTEEYVIEVHKMVFNWRLIVMPPDQEAIIDRAFCYFGRDIETLTRAIAAGLAWDDPYNTDPVGFDKNAF